MKLIKVDVKEEEREAHGQTQIQKHKKTGGKKTNKKNNVHIPYSAGCTPLSRTFVIQHYCPNIYNCNATSASMF